MRRRFCSETALAAFVLVVHTAAVSSAFAGTTLFMDASSGGVPDCASWCTAVTELQSALASVVSEDEVRVAGGVYQPDPGSGQTLEDRATSFGLNIGIVLLGGSVGSGVADPGARDVVTFERIRTGASGG